MATARQRETRERRTVSAERRLAEHHTGADRSALTIPKGMSLFNPNKAGNYTIDIIPFEAGEGNPHAEPGDYYYERTFYTHRVGPNNDTVICPARTFKKPCPVCEHRAKLAADPDCEQEPMKSLIKAMLPKERQVFNVYDHAQPDKGVQLWDISFHNFGKHLDAKINRADAELKKKLKLFADPDKGRTIVAGGSEASTGKFKYIEFADIEFRQRKEVIDDEILDQAACLDECLIPLTYVQIKELLHQAPAEEEETEPEAPVRRGRQRPVEDEPEDEPAPRARRRPPVDDEPEPEDEPAPRARRGRKPAEEEPEPETEGPEFNVGDSVTFEYKDQTHTGDITKIDKAKELYHIECDDREKPYIIGFADETLAAPKPKKKTTRQAPPEEEPEDEPAPRARRRPPVDDEPEDEPAPKPKKKPAPADDEWDELPPPRRGGKTPPAEDNDEPLEEEEPAPKARRAR